MAPHAMDVLTSRRWTRTVDGMQQNVNEVISRVAVVGFRSAVM